MAQVNYVCIQSNTLIIKNRFQFDFAYLHCVRHRTLVEMVDCHRTLTDHRKVHPPRTLWRYERLIAAAIQQQSHSKVLVASTGPSNQGRVDTIRRTLAQHQIVRRRNTLIPISDSPTEKSVVPLMTVSACALRFALFCTVARGEAVEAQPHFLGTIFSLLRAVVQKSLTFVSGPMIVGLADGAFLVPHAVCCKCTPS